MGSRPLDHWAAEIIILFLKVSDDLNLLTARRSGPKMGRGSVTVRGPVGGDPCVLEHLTQWQSLNVQSFNVTPSSPLARHDKREREAANERGTNPKMMISVSSEESAYLQWSWSAALRSRPLSSPILLALPPPPVICLSQISNACRRRALWLAPLPRLPARHVETRS